MIGFYEDEFYMLSNFSSFAVEWRGELWMTAEHAYQAAKFSDPDIREKIKNARSAHDAKKIAKVYRHFMDIDWHQVKVYVMKEILRAKRDQHPYVQKKLEQTKGQDLVETSPRDAFWGWGPNRDGENHLGKLWMELRDEVV